MKILTPGWKNLNWTIEYTCRDCGTHLLVERSDLCVRNNVGGQQVVVVETICCCCDTVIELYQYHRAVALAYCEDHFKKAWGELPKFEAKKEVSQ